MMMYAYSIQRFLMIKPNSRAAFKSGSWLLYLVFAALVSGCAGIEKPNIEQGLSNIGSSVKQSLSKVTSRTSNSSNRQTGDTSRIVRQFPGDQMPHTMMIKPVADGRLSSGFGYRINPKGIRVPRRHKGIDYAAPTGTAVYAAESGVVDKIYVSRSYGKYIRIQHANEFSTAYAHLNAFADGLEKGSVVKRGQIIGQVGSTGKSSGPHLHFELMHAGKFIDPLFQAAPADIANNN